MLNSKQKENLLPVTADRGRMDAMLSKLKDDKKNIVEDEKAYFDKEKDERDREAFYKGIDFELGDDEVIEAMKDLLRESHTNRVRYDPSEYVYPWVDLQPDGNLVSIYNGKSRQPEEVIEADYMTSLKREKEMDKVSDPERFAQIAADFKYNCEHAVPQSWFNEQEPMRGDIHHLFTCDPSCNSFRSNYPYHDFAGYTPEVQMSRIDENCGKAAEELFEPEYGKGTVARAMLYFLIRYPNQVEVEFLEQVDTDLLLEWHATFPPDLYEKHRNQAIYEIQGNRNPFIDFPQRMLKVMK
ncbi:endonuclease I family protein [Lentibacillus jeotgali]|uniref:endonuclease I family protein n=1 Tax=Lentibacillus jeotgali TaxID=558169 RepID=UPI0002628428|nr:endonuclease [Lentibacillus jeotgali]